MKMPFQTASFYGKLKSKILAESIVSWVRFQLYMMVEDEGRLKDIMEACVDHAFLIFVA